MSQNNFWSTYDKDCGYTFAITFGEKTNVQNEIISYCECIYSIYFLIEGSEILEINDVIYKINSGDIVLIKQKTNLVKQALSNNVNFIELKFDVCDHGGVLEKLILDVISNINSSISFMRIESNQFISLVKKMEAFMNISKENKENDSIQLFLDVVLRITNTVNHYTNDLDDEISNAEKIILQVMAYIHYNFNKKITTESLSQEFDMSRPYLCQKFKVYNGRTIVDYLTEVRMTYALELLSTTHEKVISIAYLVGYESVSQFNKTFKKKYHVTPSEFRESKMAISTG